jgi:hypothetical protein
LIHHIVHELESLGLDHQVLQQLLRQDEATQESASRSDGQDEEASVQVHTSEPPELPFSKAIYEFSTRSDIIEPRLHLWILPEELRNLSSIHLPAYRADHEASLELEFDDSDPYDREEAAGPDRRQSTKKSLLYMLQRELPASANGSREPDERARDRPLSGVSTPHYLM